MESVQLDLIMPIVSYETPFKQGYSLPRSIVEGFQRGNMERWLSNHSEIVLIAWNVAESMFCESKRGI